MDERTFGLRQWWAQLSSARRVETVAVVVVLIVIVGGVGVLIGRSTSQPTAAPPTPSQPAQELAPCDLFPPALAQGLVGKTVKRFDVNQVVADDATAEERARARAAAEKTCAYVPEGEELAGDNGVALQLDRNLFPSRADFMQAFDEEGSDPVSDIGDAASISQSSNGGWALSVLLDDGYSFALVVPDELADRDEVVEVGRRIADDFTPS